MNQQPQMNETNWSATWGGTKVTIFVLILVLLVAGISQAQTSKLSPDLAKMSSSATVDVVIQYNTAPTSTDD